MNQMRLCTRCGSPASEHYCYQSEVYEDTFTTETAMTLKPQPPAPSANSLREIRPDGSPSCHVCGAIMVPASKGFKCFSCGEATEPTGPDPSVVESRPRKCEHENFLAKVNVTRITDEAGNLTGAYWAEVRVNCTECGIPFVFRGVNAGMSSQKPMASVDGQELRCPIMPKDSRIFPAIPGFEVKAQ